MTKGLSSEEYLKRREELERDCYGPHPWKALLRNYEPLPRDVAISRFVSLEIEFVSDWESGLKVANMAAKWVKHRNPYYLDLALTYCHQHDIPATPTLWRLLGKLAQSRINGEELPGTPDKILRENAKEQTLVEMVNMIYHGSTLVAAASKAAYRYAEIYPEMVPYKASTLQVEYVKRYRKTGVEAKMVKGWDALGVPEEKRQRWREIVRDLPEAGPHLKGERR